MGNLDFSSKNSIFGSVDFRAQDKKDRPEGEIFKSLQYQPENATGEWQSAPLGNYYESRGALNAAMDVAFGSYTLLEGVHLYNRSNPKHLNGSFGWIARDKIAYHNGSNMVNGTVTINGVTYDVRLPSKKVNGIATVNVMTSWLIMDKLAGNRLELRNAPLDLKSGRLFGVIKHSHLEDLRKGISLTVVVTYQKIWNSVNADGTTVQSDALQVKAKEFKALVDLAVKDGFVAAQEKFFLSKAAVADTSDRKPEAVKFAEANPVTPEQFTALSNSIKVTVRALDGSEKSVPAAEITSGFFKIVAVVKGKVVDTTVYSRVFNAERSSVTPIARQHDGQIALISLKG